MTTLTELVNELKTLRKGRGIFISQIGDRVGSALRDVCQVTDDDGPAIIRRKVANKLQILASDLPADLRVAVMAAFAICPDARLPLYQDRVIWAAVRLNRDPRTARRRIDDGINQLAQLATMTPQAAPDGVSPGEPGGGWHTTEVRAVVALDRERPEVFEQRTIVADQDGLAEIKLAVTLAVLRSELDVEIFYGGTLLDSGMESSARFAFTLALPRPLARGEAHEYAIHYRLAEGQRTRPHFVCVPKHLCDVFDLRVRFDRTRMPNRIVRLADAFQRDVDDPVFQGDPLTADSAGEIHVSFRGLSSGLAYGVRWD